MTLYTTNKFKKAVKKFRRNHSNRVLDDIWKAVNKIYKQEVGSSMDNHKLTGKHTNGFKDIHLDGGNFILLYRYDVDNDTLIVSAKINNVVNHNDLHDRATYAEPQWVETTLDDLDKMINGTTIIGDDLSEDDILDWFYDFYNTEIAPILPIDDIRPIDIIDEGNYLRIKSKGTRKVKIIENSSEFLIMDLIILQDMS